MRKKIPKLRISFSHFFLTFLHIIYNLQGNEEGGFVFFLCFLNARMGVTSKGYIANTNSTKLPHLRFETFSHGQNTLSLLFLQYNIFKEVPTKKKKGKGNYYNKWSNKFVHLWGFIESNTKFPTLSH